jgi:chromosome segregation ATPase
MRHRLVPLAALGLVSCSSMYYSAWESLGYEKRDILVERVTEARDEQQDAKKQFQETLDQFKALTGFQGGELESRYKKLKSEYEDCEAQAGDVREKVASIEKVSADMFKEWTEEIGKIETAELKRQSQQMLQETQKSYGQVIQTMKQAEERMGPVLSSFRDHVLFLKHNLNAQAIASLQGQVPVIQSSVDELMRRMEASIAEADAFVKNMKKTGTS